MWINTKGLLLSNTKLFWDPYQPMLHKRKCFYTNIVCHLHCRANNRRRTVWDDDKRQLHFHIYFLWFDQQGFKIKTSWNTDNISFIIHFINSFPGIPNSHLSTSRHRLSYEILRYWLLSCSGGGVKVRICQPISGNIWDSSKVTQATFS